MAATWSINRIFDSNFRQMIASLTEHSSRQMRQLATALSQPHQYPPVSPTTAALTVGQSARCLATWPFAPVLECERGPEFPATSFTPNALAVGVPIDRIEVPRRNMASSAKEERSRLFGFHHDLVRASSGISARPGSPRPD
jgi:hypothetical protein